MDRNRIAGVLLIAAGAAFLGAALLDSEGSTLRFVAAALLMAAGILRLVRGHVARRPPR